MNKSQQVLVKNLPSKLQTLKFRDREIMDLVDSVTNKHIEEKIVMLLGLHGIGKSSVARNTLHYIYERKYVTGGILWIQLKGVRDVYSVAKHLQNHIYRSLNLTKDEINEITKSTCSEESLIQFIKEFFRNPSLPKYQSADPKKNLTKD